MLSKKAIEALKKAKKRRSRHRPSALAPPQKLRANARLEDRIIRDHASVLNSIETEIVHAYWRDDEIDDSTVAKALGAAIRQFTPEDAEVQAIVNLLDGARRSRCDVSDSLWSDALRVVLNSVRRHSQCQPGDTNYLDFVAQFAV